MQIILRLAGSATLAAALLLTGCAKKSTDQTTTSATTTTTDAGAAAASTAPDASASTAATAATPGAMTVSVSTAAPAGSGGAGFIDLPVYPGADENKDQGMSVSANGTSVSVKVYSTKDDPKKVADWYKSHLPAAWKGGVLTSGDKTVGTFANEMGDGGDQSVVVANDSNNTTRIQLTTKHGK